VTVTLTTVTDVLKVHERVELPEPVTLVGDRAHDVLLLARLTTSLKPRRPVTAIVDVPVVFADTFTVVGLALIVKS